MKLSANQTPAIVFDFGKVLIDWDPHYLYRKLFRGDDGEIDRFLGEIGFDEWNLKQDEGRPFDEAVAELCGRFPHYCTLIQAYHDRYEETITGPIWGTVEILRELHDLGYPLHAISNWSTEKFNLVRPRYPFFDLFETIILSGEVKLVKPDRRIFSLLLERIDRRAEECLLIDDSAANITAAAGLGFRTILFQSPEELRVDLMRMRVLNSAE